VWGYKQDKVKRTAIIADYEDGGLRMMDVECFVDAQKVMWVKRLLKTEQGSWKVYPDYLLGKILGKHSFQCTVNTKSLKTWMPMFYRQLFEAWGKTKLPPQEDPFKLRRQVLWQNDNIIIHKKKVLYRKWYEKGIIMFHDLLDDNGNFMERENLSRKFEVEIGVMEYNSLKAAIPQSWKRSVKEMKIQERAISSQEQPFLYCNKRLLALSITTNKDVYWEFVSRKITRPVCALMWCNRYNINIEEWKSIYKFYAEIKDTKMKAFQFKTLNNLIPCNLYLSRIGKSDTNKCTKCDELEDIMHYLANCPDSRIIWNLLSLWWKGVTGQDIEFTERDIMLGLGLRTEKTIMQYQLNCIITAVKWKIHASKQMNQNFCFFQAVSAIKQMLETLKYIAEKNERSPTHFKMWGKIVEHLTN
jgi:hypothetical protein